MGTQPACGMFPTMMVQSAADISGTCLADDKPGVADDKPGADEPAAGVLCPGRNVWRVAHASRVAVLVDGAAFFLALREALRQAQRTIFIVGWDIDSRTRLVGEDCHPDDGMPVAFADFLSALVRERPDLTVHLLLWDYSVVYALERELFPTLALHWATPRQVRLCLDDEVPLGSSHHQKIIVVDDAVAFSGGLDLTTRRWDTSDHSLANADRVDPAGEPYGPFHDVQALVDGDAARALGELVRARWARASCDVEEPVLSIGDPWPQSVVPDFHDTEIGIARTMPLYESEPEVREVETLFADTIAAAQRTIYIENQFVTCTTVGGHLVSALRRQPALEVLMVTPRGYHSWIEIHTMRNGRIRFWRMLQDAGVADRVRLAYPQVQDGERLGDTMIHSKLCIIDDSFLRVGSANLNNRSMGTDSECDLVIEARNDAQRAAIRRIRDRLAGEHCGVSGEEFAEALARTGSLLRAAAETNARGHSLVPVADGEPDPEELSATMEEVADPPHPLTVELLPRSRGRRFAGLRLATLLKVAFGVLLMLALPLAWRYTPLAQWADPGVVRRTLHSIAGSAWAPLGVIALYVAGGMVAFPVTILIAVTSATFGPFLGFAYAAAGSLVSALATYLVGAWLGKDMLDSALGPRTDRIRRRIVRQGVLSVVAVRMVPVAPFTLINLVAGASRIRLHDYLVGTALGMAPGLVVMAALGHQLFQIVTRPTAMNIALLVAAMLAWIAVSVGVQMLVARLRSD